MRSDFGLSPLVGDHNHPRGWTSRSRFAASEKASGAAELVWIEVGPSGGDRLPGLESMLLSFFGDGTVFYTRFRSSHRVWPAGTGARRSQKWRGATRTSKGQVRTPDLGHSGISHRASNR